MIKWREGKAGFAGASKRLIKGFFSSSYTVSIEVTSPTVPGLEYTLPTSRIHYTVDTSRIHYTMDEED